MGKAKEPTDHKGREKVQCRECGLWFHRLDVHISSKHSGVEDYKKKFPGAPLLSETAKRSAGESGSEDVFKFGVARLSMRDDLDEYDEKFVAKHDEQWELGVDEREALEALSLAIEDNENVLIVGPPGVGKSTLVKELSAICNHPLRRTSFRGDMRASDLVGKGRLTVDDGSGQSITDYMGGILPDASERGHWLLIDEFDSGPAEIMFILFPVLEDERSLILLGKDGGYQVSFDDNFRFIATANTLGFGDESGLYAGTAPINEALLDRFHTVITMKYPERDNEIKRIVKKSGIDKEQADKMVAIATKVREAQTRDETTASLSPRRLIMWARKTVRMGDARRAARYTITNRLPSDESVYVEGIIQRYFGGSPVTPTP